MDQATTLDRGYSEIPLPFGWFAVALSDEIAVGERKTLRYFDTEFVVWRGEDGTVRAIDPVCPHMGAHLGVSSDVVGNDLRCGFHHWSFTGGGGVSGIPYARMVPPKLKRSCTYAWPVDERDGLVFVWYHPLRVAPKWEVASLPPCPEGEWEKAGSYEWIVNIHVQEITENGQDHAHFGAVHGVPGAPKGEFKLDGWQRRNVVVAEMNTPRGPMRGTIDNFAMGPGQSFSQFIDVTHVVMHQTVTAIDREHTHVRWQVYHLPGISDGKLRVAQARIRDVRKQIEQDIPIWNAKTYLKAPLLVDGDGPILAYRSQYAKFYQFEDDKPALSAV
jgi:3-ketosteroid 9alpha-monooxygenase subunit A